MTDDRNRYWKELQAEGKHWSLGVNRNGVRMRTAEALFQADRDYSLGQRAPGLGRASAESIENQIEADFQLADSYGSIDIRERALREAHRALSGGQPRYAYTDMLLEHAIASSDHREIAELGCLPQIPEPDLSSMSRGLYDRQKDYNGVVARAERTLMRQDVHRSQRGGGRDR
ncbi:MAG: hypothetical protein AAGK98_18730 [Pseudomonadota bacterium]